MKSLLNISDLTKNDLIEILNIENKEKIQQKNIGMIFEKPSTRTRVSFSVAIQQLGGNAIDIRFDELNISREESFEDTFRALNCYLDGLVYRTKSHQNLIEASQYFEKPIINALSDISHPCQIIGDLITLKEHFGSLNLQILWAGDMNNVCFSLVEAVNIIDDISLTIFTPKSISNKKKWDTNSNIYFVDKIDDLNLMKINCVMTDVFISMNDKKSEEKILKLKPYSVNKELMSKTSSNCVFMHCLPAKVGHEVSEDVFKSHQSIVWKQAYNRLVGQKKLLQFIYK